MCVQNHWIRQPMCANLFAHHPCVQKTHIRQRKMIDTQPMCAKDTEQKEDNYWHTTPVCKSKPWACKMLSLVPSHLKHLDGTSHHKQTWSGEPKDICPWKLWACSHHLWSASKTWQESCTLPCMFPPALCCPTLDLETLLSHQSGASSGAWLECSICSNLLCLNHLQPMTTWDGFLL